jgi:hypothetical protein
VRGPECRVIPAQAGIQKNQLDSRFRGNDIQGGNHKGAVAFLAPPGLAEGQAGLSRRWREASCFIRLIGLYLPGQAPTTCRG